jgi:hypothetical protein
MKKALLTIGCGIALATSNAFAVPALQLDILGGTYDSGSGTIIASGNPLTLVALYDPSQPLATTSFFISAAIVPKTSDINSFGSFSINSTTYSGANANVQFGTPPVSAVSPNLLPDHGIFPTVYAQVAFSFDPSKTAALYDSSLMPGGLTPDAAGTLQYMEFTVDVSGLVAGDVVHFDLYDDLVNNHPLSSGSSDYAPFSNDAASGLPVPDGGMTLGLLGLACLVIVGIQRRIAGRTLVPVRKKR